MNWRVFCFGAVRKAHWLGYLEGMLDARSVRRSAADTGVSCATSFRWRHRFLSVSKDDQPEWDVHAPQPT